MTDLDTDYAATLRDISAVLSSIAGKSHAITAETNIVRDLGLDSLAVMNFIMALEERFDVSVPLDRVAEIETVGDLARTLNELRAAA